MKRITLLFAFLVMSIGWAAAQSQVEVSGTVISAEDNQPIIGAAVRGKVSKQGAQTNIDGKFKFNVPASEKVLVVSFMGMKTREVAVGKDLRIVLQPDETVLDEVMVVAYGTAKKSTFTGSAVVVDSKKLEKIQSADAAKALEGMVPGLSVTSSSGAPGAGTTLRVRGIGSLNASSAPLIIVDGAPYSGDINSINSKDIESINVLKDAASAALYGARAANGVILIQTKRGKDGLVSVTFDARVGKNYRGVPEYDIMINPGTYYTMMWEAIKNSQLYSEAPLSQEDAAKYASNKLIQNLGYNIYKGVADSDVVGVDGILTSNTTIKYEDAATFNDWMSLLYKPQWRQEYNLSVNRGSGKNNVFFSFGYLDDKGFNVASGFERISSRLSYDSQIYDWLKVSTSSQLAKTSTDFVASGNAYANTFQWTRSIAPIYPVYRHDADGKIVLDANGEKVYDDGSIYNGVHGARAYAANMNLPAQQRMNKDQYLNLYLTQNFRADVVLPYGFNFNTTATYYMNHWDRVYFRNPKLGDGAAYGGILSKDRNYQESLNWNQVLVWDKKIGDLTLQAMAGHEIYTQNTYYMSGEKRQLLDPELTEFISAAKITALTSYKQNYNIEGFFGQATADYADKYYVSASFRRDASSVFAPEHRWGTFYSFGGSWRIAQEDFLKDIRAIDNLKLRASYGVQGNDYLYLPGTSNRSYTPYTNTYTIGSDGENSTFSPAYKGTRNITWEKNINFNVGLEFSFFKGMIAGELDFFQRRTDDMLFNLPISSATGFSTEPRNIGNMVNTGFEFNLSSRVYSTDKINVTLGVNGSGYKNKILNLPEEFREDGITQGYRIIKEGGGIYDFWMIKYAGVNEETGDALYYQRDADGNFVATASKDYKTDNKHKQFIGSGIPKMIGGFYTTVNAYGFDFSAQFSYRIGGIVYDSQYASLMSAGTAGNNWHVDILNRWTPTNTKTDVPRVHLNSQGLIQTSDRFMIDGSYLNLRNITLGYTLPENVNKILNVKGLRAYIVADNVALWSKRKGLDPRIAISGQQESATNSAIRTISFGLSVNI